MIKKLLLVVLLIHGGIAMAMEGAGEQPLKVLAIGLGKHMTKKLIPALDSERFRVVYGSRRSADKLKQQTYIDEMKEFYAAIKSGRDLRANLEAYCQIHKMLDNIEKQVMEQLKI